MSTTPDEIKKSLEIDKPIERVWRALTDFREFGEWFGVRLDGPFIEGQAATGQITHPGYEHLKFELDVKQIEPESRFVFTWHPYAVDLDVDYSDEMPTLVSFRLEPVSNGCHLSVTEAGFDQIPGHRRAEAFRMNDQGWAIQMENISRHVGENP